MLQNFEAVLAFAGIAALISATYQLWTPQKVIRRHHDTVVRVLEQISRSPWLELMQSGVRWVLRLMDAIYGPPSRFVDSKLANFFTIRAWQASAWIAAFILLALPFAILAVAIPVTDAFRGTDVPWDALLVFGALFVFMCGIFYFAYLRLWKRTVPTARVVPNLARESAFLAALEVLAMAFFVIAVSISPSESRIEGPAANVAAGAATLVIFAGPTYHFIRVIRIYAFLAPAAFAAHLIISLLVATLVAVAVTGINTEASLWIKGLGASALLLAAGFVVHALRAAPAKANQGFLLLAVAVGLCLLMISQTSQSPLADVGGGAARAFAIVSLYVVPYVLAAYAVIYSNSLPDWASISLTRYFLSHVARAPNYRMFLIYLVVDGITATLCIASTMLMLVSVFWVCGLLLSLADAGSGIDTGTAGFFFGATGALPILVELMRGSGWDAAVQTGTARSIGGVTVAILVVLGATSIVPTILNACILILLILGRIGALTIGDSIRVMHAQLIIPSSATKEQARLCLLRSSILIGTLGAAAVTILHIAIAGI